MVKTTLITLLVLSIAITMAMSSDSSDLKLEKSADVLDQSYISNLMRKLKNGQGGGKQPELEVYLLKKSSTGSWNSGNEKKPVVRNDTDNIDCQCKCARKKQDGLAVRSNDDISGYNDDPMETHGNIITAPKRKKSFSCAPDSFWDGSKCAPYI
ncbi:hypothetical protein V1478_006414 [Vespula squamosa]|uniref:Uncharacterized protein n=1 Tax=Vespula squamosa TaxID=30214 RepID=A0ABD2B7U6_VESSQ